MRGIVWSTLISLPSGDRDRDGHVGLLRLALVLDLDVERQLVADGHAVDAAVGQHRAGRLDGDALEAGAVQARRGGLVARRRRSGRAASRRCPGRASRGPAGTGRSGTSPRCPLRRRRRSARGSPLQVDHVACQQRLHLAGDRVDRGAAVALVAERGREQRRRSARSRPRGTRRPPRASRCAAFSSSGWSVFLARSTSCSASTRWALTWVWTSSASARLGFESRLEEAVAEIWLEPLHERAHVGGVVPEGAVLAAVEAAVDADHQQDDHDHDARRGAIVRRTISVWRSACSRHLAALGERAGRLPSGEDKIKRSSWR